MKVSSLGRAIFGLLSILFLIDHRSSIGQNREIDSIQKLVKNESRDTVRLSYLTAISSLSYNYGFNDTAEFYSKKVLSLLPNLISTSKGRKYKLLNIYATFAHNTLGLISHYKGIYPLALEHFFKCIKVDEEINDTISYARHIGNIGLVYQSTGEEKKAILYLDKSFRAWEKMGAKYGMHQVMINLAASYDRLGDQDKALLLYQKALRFYDTTEIYAAKNVLLGNIGIIYASKKDYKTALDYLLKALEVSKILNVSEQVTRHLNNIGNLYIETKSYKEAFDHIYASLSLSHSAKLNSQIINAYEYLSYLYEKSTVSIADTLGGKLLNMEQMRLRSLYYYQRMTKLKNEMFNEENRKAALEKEVKYEFEKKEVIAKEQFDRQLAVAAAEKKKQNVIIASIILGLIGVVVFAFFVMRSLRLTRKQKGIIEQQKAEVEAAKQIVDEKQKEILDSIRYAKRIQNAIITSEYYIGKSIKKLKSRST